MKKLILFILITIAFTRASFTQQEINRESSNQEYSATSEEIMPEFPGGEKALMKFIRKNTKYPSLAVTNKIEGKVVVRFFIEKDGAVSTVEILKSIGYGCDEEAMRVVKLMPRWKPGSLEGKPVRVSFMLPINFMLHKKKSN